MGRNGREAIAEVSFQEFRFSEKPRGSNMRGRERHSPASRRLDFGGGRHIEAAADLREEICLPPHYAGEAWLCTGGFTCMLILLIFIETKFSSYNLTACLEAETKPWAGGRHLRESPVSAGLSEVEPNSICSLEPGTCEPRCDVAHRRLRRGCRTFGWGTLLKNMCLDGRTAEACCRQNRA